MYLYFKVILDFIFPPSEDEKCIASVTLETFQKKYSLRRTSDITTLASFADPIVRAAIHLNKFHNHNRAQELLASLLVHYLNSQIMKDTILIPIPLSKKRQQERGHNQVISVAIRALASTHKVELVDTVLIKTADTKPQTTLSRQERLHNLKGVYACDPRTVHSIKNKHILLLDDVSTTGTTLHEAKATLLPHDPASITCIALAH